MQLNSNQLQFWNLSFFLSARIILKYENFLFNSSVIVVGFFQIFLNWKTTNVKKKNMQLYSFENLLHSWGHLNNLINKLRP